MVAPQDEAALNTIRKIAVERGSPMVDVGHELSWQPQHAELDGQVFTVNSLNDTYEVTLPLIGEYQQENAATAIAAAEDADWQRASPYYGGYPRWSSERPMAGSIPGAGA